MPEKVIPVLSKTFKANKMPDIRGFIQAMKDMGAKVSMKEGTIVIDMAKCEKQAKETKQNLSHALCFPSSSRSR